MTTVQNIHDRLPLAASVRSVSDTILALNAAIWDSWPLFKLTHYEEDAITLVAGTFEYSLSALSPAPHPELGISKAFINEDTDLPPVRHRDVTQRHDTSTAAWTLVFGAGLVSRWAGKTVDLAYQYMHPEVTAASSTVLLPPNYAVSYVVYWYAQRKLTDTPAAPEPWRTLYERHARDWPAALNGNRVRTLPPLPLTAKDRRT